MLDFFAYLLWPGKSYITKILHGSSRGAGSVGTGAKMSCMHLVHASSNLRQCKGIHPVATESYLSGVLMSVEQDSTSKVRLILICIAFYLCICICIYASTHGSLSENLSTGLSVCVALLTRCTNFVP